MQLREDQETENAQVTDQYHITINMYVCIQVSGFRETSLGIMQINFISVDLRMYAYAHLIITGRPK